MIEVICDRSSPRKRVHSANVHSATVALDSRFRGNERDTNESLP
jgi:hypothetical protein